MLTGAIASVHPQGRHFQRVQAESAQLAALAGLGDLAGGHVHAGEPAGGVVDPGVQADAAGAHGGQAGVLRGVAADHGPAGEVRVGVGEARPEEPVIALLMEGQHGVEVGVDEDVGVRLMQAAAPPGDELDVRFGDEVPGDRLVTAVGLQRLQAADGLPGSQVEPFKHGLHEQDLVVAGQGNELGGLFQADEGVQHALGVGAAVHIIPERHQHVVRARLHGFQQGAQGGGAAVNVTDGQCPHGALSRARRPAQAGAWAGRCFFICAAAVSG